MKIGTGSYWRRSILLKMFRPLSRETSFSEERPPMMIPTRGFRAVFVSPAAPISEAHRQGGGTEPHLRRPLRLLHRNLLLLIRALDPDPHPRLPEVQDGQAYTTNNRYFPGGRRPL